MLGKTQIFSSYAAPDLDKGYTLLVFLYFLGMQD